MKIVRENIEFKRGVEPRKSLELGFEASPWSLHDHLVELFKSKGYFVRKSSKSFEHSDNFIVIFNIGVSTEDNLDKEPGLSFLRFKDNEKFKYGVDPRVGDDDDAIIFESDDWEECVEVIEKKLTFYSQDEKVDENLNFERGKDPKKSLNVGIERKMYPPFDSIKQGTYLVQDKDGMWFLLRIPKNPLDTRRTVYWSKPEYAREATEFHTWVDLPELLDDLVSMQEL